MRPRIRQRRRIFLGCEGESEQGYGALLQKIADAHNRAVHIDAVLLRPGGGDPLALVELAINRLEDKISKREPTRRVSFFSIAIPCIDRTTEIDARPNSPSRTGSP